MWVNMQHFICVGVYTCACNSVSCPQSSTTWTHGGFCMSCDLSSLPFALSPLCLSSLVPPSPCWHTSWLQDEVRSSPGVPWTILSPAFLAESRSVRMFLTHPHHKTRGSFRAGLTSYGFRTPASAQFPAAEWGSRSIENKQYDWYSSSILVGQWPLWKAWSSVGAKPSCGSRDNRGSRFVSRVRRQWCPLSMQVSGAPLSSSLESSLTSSPSFAPGYDLGRHPLTSVSSSTKQGRDSLP